MPELLFSTNTLSSTKEITHGGRRYLVSPVVALREGILNGVYVSSTEFSKFAASWAGRPVPIGHPKNEGGYISANSPDVWANDVPGHIWNVEADGDKLRGEIWIDLAKAETMGEHALGIVNRLRAGTPVEVSTGYFADHDTISGVWNGQPYLGVARNIRPDHLALLPDEIGACSWADGCGTPRVNVKEGEPMVEETRLFERFLGWFRQHKELEIIDNEATPPCVEESSQGDEMTKDQLITVLVANCKCKFSKDKLQTWAESDLQVLQESLSAEEPAAEPAPEMATAAPVAASLPPELSAWMAGITAELAEQRSMVKGLTANSEREKAELVSAIVANSHGAWSEADLMEHDLPKLNQVYSSYLPRDYSGNGGYVRQSGPEEEAMPMPWPDEFKKLGV